MLALGVLSSFPFLRFRPMSLILVRAPLGFSGGRLVARDGTPTARRLLFEELRTLVEEAFVPAVLRLFLLVDLPWESRSNTFDPEARRGSLAEEDLDSRSIKEFFLVTGFFRSFRECPGLMLPLVPGLSTCSTLMMGTEVTYFPSTSSES